MRFSTVNRFILLLYVALFALIGCRSDLKKVHSTHLQKVSVGQAKRARPGHKIPVSHTSTVPPRSQWRIFTSLTPREFLTDDDPFSLAVAPDPARFDQSILIDLGHEVDIIQVTQRHGDAAGFPKQYRIDVADDHNFPYELVWIGAGSPGYSQAIFSKPRRCRFLRLTLLGAASHTRWEVGDLVIE